MFHEIVEEIHHRLASQKGGLLNRARRLCLVKSVLTFLLVYIMQDFFLSNVICEIVWPKNLFGQLTTIKEVGT